MYINPYGAAPVTFAAQLANDRPSTPSALAKRCREAGVVIEKPATAGDIRQVNQLLDDWLSVVDAAGEHERAERLNRLLARYAEHPRLTDHSGQWHLHYRRDWMSLSRLLATMITVGTALHLTERGMDRLARCLSPDCDRAYADISRNGRQRYCSVRCGTREAVRRHRGRGDSPISRTSRTVTAPRSPLPRPDTAAR